MKWIAYQWLGIAALTTLLVWFEPPVDIFVTNEQYESFKAKEEAERLEWQAKEARDKANKLERKVKAESKAMPEPKLPRWHEVAKEIVRLQNKIEEIERVRIVPLEKEIERLRRLLESRATKPERPKILIPSCGID